MGLLVSEQQVDPFACGLKFILNFLAFLIEKNYEYSSINVYRSALYVYQKKINNYLVGQNPKVCSLMTGIFNERPPNAKYVFIWDIEQVLIHVKKLQSNEQNYN